MRFLASADLHIRKKEDCALLARILQTAKDTACGAVLLGGDLLDSPFIDDQTESALLTLLGAAPCPVFLVAGNHDPLEVTAFYRKLPQGVYCFPAAITAVTLAQGVRLFGYSAPREQNPEHLLAGFTAPSGGVNILLAHGQTDGGRGSFQPLSAEELIHANLQLAVVGHIHKGEQRMVGDCHLLVPGIPEGRGWDETGEKWVYVIDADPVGGICIEACSVAERWYMEYPVDLTDCNEPAEMLAKMESTEISAGVIGRLILVGSVAESPAPAIQIYTEKYGREVKDQTDTFGSVEVLREQNTLQGAFVRKAMAEIQQAAPADRPRLEAALQLGLRALKEAKR